MRHKTTQTRVGNPREPRTAASATTRRDQGEVPARKPSFLTEDIRAAVEAPDRDTLAGKRDAALLLVGFTGVFRVSEIIGIDVEHLEGVDEGIEGADPGVEG